MKKAIVIGWTIEKDDYRDRQGLMERIIPEINKPAKKHFQIVDYLK